MLDARRKAALGAFSVVLLWGGGFALAGKPPAFVAPPAEIASYFHGHHKQILITVIAVWIGIAIYVGVHAQLMVELRDAGHRVCGLSVALAAAAAATVLAIYCSIYGALAQPATFHGADPGLQGALYRVDQFVGVPDHWFVLVILVAVMVAGMRGGFPAWSVWLNGLLLVPVVLGGIAVKASGVFAVGTGLFVDLAFFAALAFLLEVGVVLWTKQDV